ncbi:MAG: insulinase family protein, partial [Paludibacter sp.]|nr:insulinase family protein [Paludibacter sp.]
FGNDLNAYTSFDETIYILPVPLDKPENLKTGLKVIEDWAFNALLTDEQIDKERGVILEELRMGLGAGQRIRDKILPVILKDSRYAVRLPIGKEEIIKNCKYDVLRRFHRDWYRPDLMAVIVVGDINVNEIEGYIKENFSKYKNPANERPRTVYEVPDHAETLIAAATDKEMPQSIVSVDYNQNGMTKVVATVADYNDKIIENLLFNIVNNRLNELVQSANPPFTYGGVYHNNVVRTKEGLSAYAVVTEGKQLDAMNVLLTEIERAKLGVGQSELDRAKTELLSAMEKSYNDREKTESSNYVQEYIRNFLEKEPIPGIAWEYNQYKTFLPSVTLNQVNDVLAKYVQDENRTVTMYGPDKEGANLPAQSAVLAIFDEVKNSDIEKYDDKVAIEQLVKNLPNAGSIVKTEKDDKLGTQTFTLSNGVKVVAKKTDFKNDEILFYAVRKGGSSLLNDADYLKTQWAFDVLGEAGLNGYSKNDLTKYLAGKQVNVELSIKPTYESLQGKSTPKDLPTLFELAYSYFTGLNYEPEIYLATVQRISAVYDNVTSMPNYYFINELNKFRMKNNPRFTNIVPMKEDWARTDFKLAYDFYKNKFANANDFVFYFVGNFDENTVKSLATKYLAALPGKGVAENFRDNGYRPVYSAADQIWKKGNDPKSMIQIIYSGELKKFDQTEAIQFDALAEVMQIKMIEILREELGGVYSAGIRQSIQPVPYPSYSMTLVIPCGPENVEKLKKSTFDIVKNVISNGPDQKDLDKYKEEAYNELRDDLKKNSTWMDFLIDYQLNDGDKYLILNKENLIKNVTVSQIQNVAKKYLRSDNRLIATLMPEDDGWQDKVAEKNAPARASDVSAESVINNYINALGGKSKLESVKTLLIECTISVSGMVMPTVIKQMSPNKQHTEMTCMGMTMIQNFDGQTGYMSQGGMKMETPAEMIAKYSEEEMIDALKMDAGKIKSVEIKTIDGKDYYVLTNDKGEKNYFDKTTWLLYRTETQEGTTTNKSYGEFDGIMFPTETVQTIHGEESTMKTTKITINKEVTEQDFK